MLKQIKQFHKSFFFDKTLTHYGVHRHVNAGDNVLFSETRNLFDFFLDKSNWQKKHVRKLVTIKTIKSINKKSSAIVVGGGGLLLKDTAPNKNSGWQWNCPIESLLNINIPLIIFAIGYNRFNNQDDFDDIFTKHIIKSIYKSSFFGLRNYGSITSLKEYLPKEFHSKLSFQPCPTTLLSYLYPKIKKNSLIKKKLTVNLAFDRSNYRYNNNLDEILNNISIALLNLQKSGWQIDYVKHSRGDEHAIEYFKKNNLTFNYLNFYKKNPKIILKYYQSTPITLGMRGHSQMIPFGFQNNIISLISHPKLKYFLDDIDHPSWGIDIFSKNIIDEIINKVNNIGYENWEENNANLIKAQKKLFNCTEKNFTLIKKIINKT